MKKNLSFFLSLLFFVGVLLWSCQKAQEETQDKPEEALLYPNKDSELALLMRDMYEDAASMKKALEAQKLPEDFRAKFKQIHSAEATDPTVRSAAFDNMSEAFLAQVEALYQPISPSERSKAFNLMVQNCISCHQVHCPGPIKKIKKLHIRLEE
jgi:cytochrome c556